MAKTIIVGGYGPGISAALAEKFGSAGFTVALVARSADKLNEGVKALTAKGISAAAFPGDLGSPAAVKAIIGQVRDKFGPISALHWNGYSSGAGDLLSADAAALHGIFDLAIVGLLTAIQEALPDLKQQQGAILVTNGGLLFNEPSIDDNAVKWNAMGLAVANAAKHKVVGLLAQKLKGEGVFIGEVIVTGAVKGTAFDNGAATIEASGVAQKFWDLYSARKDTIAQI
ncbi:MAG TPA: SDR family NAD(P)-dependent oxidoreductase [Polyangiaceae bacterium]|nr:SDR family NAD(P)-dependent oxidoreductase [Polyangiaceae bacterium]